MHKTSLLYGTTAVHVQKHTTLHILEQKVFLTKNSLLFGTVDILSVEASFLLKNCVINSELVMSPFAYTPKMPRSVKFDESAGFNR